MNCRTTLPLLVLALLAPHAIAKARITPSTKPLWDLTGSADLKTPLDLSAETAFDIPNSAIPGSGAFAVRLEVAFGDEWNGDDDRFAPLLSQRVGDTGWALSLRGAPKANDGNIVVDVGGERMREGKIAFLAQPGQTHSFAVKSRNGVVTLYVDDIVRSQWFQRVVPNLEPIAVGRTANAPDGTAYWKGLRLVSLQVYGPDEPFMAPGESEIPASGIRSGKGWFVNGPGDVSDAARPRVLCYGDSIMLGYSPGLRKELEGKAYVFDWCHCCPDPGPVDGRLFTEVASVAPFDFIFFNNGLHSLHWGAPKITDGQIEESYRSMVKAFRKGAPKAKLVYLTTTPLLAAAPKGQPATAVGPRNDSVLRLNAIARKVMDEEGVEVIDLYALLIDHLDYANGGGDIFHWSKDRGYPVIFHAVADRIMAL